MIDGTTFSGDLSEQQMVRCGQRVARIALCRSVSCPCPCLTPTLRHPAPRTRLPAQVDCVNSALGYGSAGCNGGYSSDVLSYVAGFRATTETDYG